jgi:hypothetical protein
MALVRMLLDYVPACLQRVRKESLSPLHAQDVCTSAVG